MFSETLCPLVNCCYRSVIRDFVRLPMKLSHFLLFSFPYPKCQYCFAITALVARNYKKKTKKKHPSSNCLPVLIKKCYGQK